MVVIGGLIMFGLGQGALATLLFNLLVAHAPREFGGDVGSLRGMLKNVGAGIGTAIAGSLVARSSTPISGGTSMPTRPSQSL